MLHIEGKTKNVQVYSDMSVTVANWYIYSGQWTESVQVSCYEEGPRRWYKGWQLWQLCKRYDKAILVKRWMVELVANLAAVAAFWVWIKRPLKTTKFALIFRNQHQKILKKVFCLCHYWFSQLSCHLNISLRNCPFLCNHHWKLSFCW